MARALVQRPALALGGAGLIGVGVVVGLGVFDASHAERTSTSDARVDSIELDTGSGDVAIRVGDVDEVTVVERLTYRWGAPSRTYEVHGGTLELVSCGDWWCEVDYEVVVPRDLAISGNVGSGSLEVAGASSVDVEVGSGETRLADVAGDVRLELGSGDAELDGVGGRLVAEGGSGSLAGRDLRGPVDAEVGSGSIDVALAESSDVTASVGSGELTVAVPRGSYRVEGETGSGSRQLGIADDPDARHTLTLDSGSGDVTLERR